MKTVLPFEDNTPNYAPPPPSTYPPPSEVEMDKVPEYTERRGYEGRGYDDQPPRYNEEKTPCCLKFKDLFCSYIQEDDYQVAFPRFVRGLPHLVFYFLILLFTIAVTVFFIFDVQRKIDDRNGYTSSQCATNYLQESGYKCCKVGDCHCQSCHAYPDCHEDQLATLPANNSYCCGGSDCCQTCCSICRDCNSKGECTTYKCNCYCCDSVSHKTCEYYCGLCYDYILSYRLYLDNPRESNVFNLLNNNHPYVNMTHTDHCDQDNLNCQSQNRAKGYPSMWDCWWKSPSGKPEDISVRFNGVPPYPTGDIVGGVFLAIPLLIMVLIWIVYPIVFYYCVLMKAIFVMVVD